MINILSKVKAWFGKQESSELAHDVSHDRLFDSMERGSHHKDKMMDRIEQAEAERADEEGL